MFKMAKNARPSYIKYQCYILVLFDCFFLCIHCETFLKETSNLNVEGDGNLFGSVTDKA